MNKILLLWDTTFPLKCSNFNCDGRCEYSIKVGRNSFCSQYNLLCKALNKRGEQDLHFFWSLELNFNVNPLLLAFKSKKKFLFKCLMAKCQHHEWKGSISNFKLGNRCPYCSGKKICPCDSAANQVKDLHLYWHPTKNTISPYKIAPNCNSKFWFKCPIAKCNHHEWQTTMSSFNFGRRCAFCINRKVCPCNSAANHVKDLALYWHPTKNTISPYEIAPNCNSKFWFKCPIAKCDHHEWQTTMISFNFGNRCLFCRGLQICHCDSAWFNTLNIRYGWNRSLNNDIDPRTLSKQNNQLFWFNCLKGKHPPFQRLMYRYYISQICRKCSKAGTSQKEKIMIRVFEIWLNKASLSQARIPGIGKIDGYFPEENISIEFHGCFWHGCPKCYPNRTQVNSTNGKTYEQLYLRTIERDQKLSQLFNHTVIWECDIEDCLQSPRADLICKNSNYTTRQLYNLACQQIRNEDLDVNNLPSDILTDYDFARFDALQNLRHC